MTWLRIALVLAATLFGCSGSESEDAPPEAKKQAFEVVEAQKVAVAEPDPAAGSKDTAVDEIIAGTVELIGRMQASIERGAESCPSMAEAIEQEIQRSDTFLRRVETLYQREGVREGVYAQSDKLTKPVLGLMQALGECSTSEEITAALSQLPR